MPFSSPLFPDATFVQCINVRCQFVGYHRWVNAPDQVAFLREWHRHVFHVRVMLTVEHADRDLEFFMVQLQIQEMLNDYYRDGYFEKSCEMLCQEIMLWCHENKLPAVLTEVSEDGENFATFIMRPGNPTTVQIGHIDKELLKAEIEKFQSWDKAYLNREMLKDGGESKEMDFAGPFPSQQPPATPDRSDNPCFIGTEAEGPHKGVLTLFVPGKATEEQVREAVEVFHKVWERSPDKHPNAQFYYGAGNDQDLNWSALAFLHKAFANQMGPRIVEVKSWGIVDPSVKNFLSGHQGITVVSLNVHDVGVKRVNFVKCVNEKENRITWQNTDNNHIYTSELNDPLFAQDKKVGEFKF